MGAFESSDDKITTADNKSSREICFICGSIKTIILSNSTNNTFVKHIGYNGKPIKDSYLRLSTDQIVELYKLEYGTEIFTIDNIRITSVHHNNGNTDILIKDI